MRTLHVRTSLNPTLNLKEALDQQDKVDHNSQVFLS